MSDIEDFLEYIIKKQPTVHDNPSTRIYVNETENRITFKTKKGHCLELLTPEEMKLLGSTKSRTTKNKHGENVPNLEITEVVLFHYNVVNNDYQ